MKESITKKGMLKIVSKEYKDHFLEIFLRASVCMEIIFGLDMNQVDPGNHCCAVLIRMGLAYDGVLHSEKGMPETGILIFILGAIFMKGNQATEGEVWEVLSMMGLYSGRKHCIFEEPRKLITEYFVEKKYLKYQQVANSDSAQF